MSAEISKQIASTQSEASRHAIAYGRFLELVLRSDALIPNVQTIVRKTFDRHGNPTSITSFDIYSNTVSGMFRSYLTIRDRDLKPVIVRELEQFKSDVKASSAETASRNFVKLSFERAFEETALFSKIFGITPHFSTDSTSASALISGYQRALVNVANIKPIAVTLQSVLSAANLGTLTSVVGWLANEYLIEDYEDEDTDFMLLCRELAARLLSEHLWPYTDAAVEVEVSKSITKATIAPESLKIGPVVNGVASSNAHPIVKRALELLTMYDQAMPKERSVCLTALLRES